MNGLKILTSSFILLFGATVFAEDFGIAMPDQLQGEERLLETGKGMKAAEDSPDFIMGERDSLETKLTEDEKGNSYILPGSSERTDKDLSEKERILSTGNDVPFKFENKENLIEFKNSEIFNQIANRGDSAFSFAYIKDDYEVTDSQNVFQNSFENASGSKRGGAVHLSFDNYMTRGFLNTYYGFGFGVGFWEGRGRFASSATQESNVILKLYYAPVDFRLGLELNPSKYFKIGLSGGPSVMGLFQSRSDKNQNEEDKYRRQVSYGYFGSAKLQISMSGMSKSLAFKTFSQSDLTNMFLNFEARMQSYENFQDDVSITGASFGLGVSFEYL
ncbi:MAG: hypothetical protein NXH75_02500 [Halobacteriovoraceae bacterium]|nr:hypothetical protein [Halobacteriovoraceae bacterium]